MAPSTMLWRFLTLSIACAIAIGCLPVGDGPQSVQFHGQRYDGWAGSRLNLSARDTREIGTAEDVSRAGRAANATVYEIRGVDPDNAIVLRSRSRVPRNAFLLFVRGSYPAGLCQYESDPASRPECN